MTSVCCCKTEELKCGKSQLGHSRWEWVSIRRKEGEEAQHLTEYFPPKYFPFPYHPSTLPTDPSYSSLQTLFSCSVFTREKFNMADATPLLSSLLSLYILWPCFAFIGMEGTSNKSHKSRLFTSNVLLQKDELEEVGFTFLYSLFEIDGR